MATWDDVRRVFATLPEAEETAPLQWRVRKKLIAWNRPLRQVDLAALDLAPTEEPTIGVRTPDVIEKEALIEGKPEVFFETPHFDGYPAVLIWLERVDRQELGEVLTEGWITQAPKSVSRAFLERGAGS